jgi:hypothetical protein
MIDLFIGTKRRSFSKNSENRSALDFLIEFWRNSSGFALKLCVVARRTTNYNKPLTGLEIQFQFSSNFEKQDLINRQLFRMRIWQPRTNFKKKGKMNFTLGI